MGAEGAAKIVFRKEIAAAADKAAEEKPNWSRSYKEKFYNPVPGSRARGYVDDVIEPRDTRTRPCLIQASGVDGAASATATPPKKHGNIPL